LFKSDYDYLILTIFHIGPSIYYRLIWKSHWKVQYIRFK